MKKKVYKSIILTVILIFLGSGIAMAGDAEMEQLKQQIQQLTNRITELEEDKRPGRQVGNQKRRYKRRWTRLFLNSYCLPGFSRRSGRKCARGWKRKVRPKR